MRLSACFCVLLLAVLVGCGPSTSPVKVTAVPNPPQGWMADGWGEVKYTFDNRTDDPGKVIGWSCQWEAAGEPVGDVWFAHSAAARPRNQLWDFGRNATARTRGLLACEGGAQGRLGSAMSPHAGAGGKGPI